MKQKLQIVTAIVAILIGLTACQKTTKDQLIGTWHYTATTTIDGGIINIEGTDTNKEDGTYSGVANAICTFDTEIDGVNVQIKMGISMKGSGEWTVNDKEIVSSPTSSGVKVTYMRYYDPSDGSFPINNTIGKNLDDANNLRKIIDKIVQEYPFTEKFFQDGMKNVTCFLKKEIDKIELH